MIAAFVIFSGTSSRGEILTKGWPRVLGTASASASGRWVVASLVAGSTVVSVATSPRDRRRPYDSALRREQARATRAQIATAARRLFAAWGGRQPGCVTSPARPASPSRPSTRPTRLARALIDAVELSADVVHATAELRSGAGTRPRKERGQTPDQVEQWWQQSLARLLLS